MVPTETPLEPWRGPWHLLGKALRTHRHANEASLSDVATFLGVSRKSVSHWEHARYHIELRHCRALDEHWDTGGVLELLRTVAAEGRQPRWFADYTRFELEASYLRIYQCLTVPGLLQTEAYARMVLTRSRAEDVDDQVRQRMARQRLLTRKDPPQVGVLLDERVLDAAEPEIMHDQLEHLVALGDLPHVTLRIIPNRAAWYIGLVGSFHLITSHRRDVVYVDAPGGGRLAKGGETEEFRARWEEIGTLALPWDLSRDKLVNLMEGHA
jgi:transcriptional regulator with XRE-family HTH domain